MTALAISVPFRSCRAASAGLSVADMETVSHGCPSLSPREVSPVWNAHAFRRSFPLRWAEYLRKHYGTAYAVERAFPGIDGKTARDWISGKRNPSGSFVAAVIKQDATAMEILGRIE